MSSAPSQPGTPRRPRWVAPLETPPELLADAVEALERQVVPTGEAFRAIVELAKERPSVAGELRRRRAHRLWKELWATGEFSSFGAVDERVAAHVGVAPATVRVWRFREGLS